MLNVNEVFEEFCSKCPSWDVLGCLQIEKGFYSSISEDRCPRLSKSGKWIYHGDIYGLCPAWECPLCKKLSNKEHNFCPNCGSKMEVLMLTLKFDMDEQFCRQKNMITCPLLVEYKDDLAVCRYFKEENGVYLQEIERDGLAEEYIRCPQCLEREEK